MAGYNPISELGTHCLYETVMQVGPNSVPYREVTLHLFMVNWDSWGIEHSKHIAHVFSFHQTHAWLNVHVSYSVMCNGYNASMMASQQRQNCSFVITSTYLKCIIMIQYYITQAHCTCLFTIHILGWWMCMSGTHLMCNDHFDPQLMP